MASNENARTYVITVTMWLYMSIEILTRSFKDLLEGNSQWSTSAFLLPPVWLKGKQTKVIIKTVHSRAVKFVAFSRGFVTNSRYEESTKMGIIIYKQSPNLIGYWRDMDVKGYFKSHKTITNAHDNAFSNYDW
jgi:hypothetical protein